MHARTRTHFVIAIMVVIAIANMYHYWRPGSLLPLLCFHTAPYLHTCRHMRPYTRVHTHVYPHVETRAHTDVQTHVHTHHAVRHVCTHAHTHAHTHATEHVSVHMSMHMSMHTAPSSASTGAAWPNESHDEPRLLASSCVTWVYPSGLTDLGRVSCHCHAVIDDSL